MTFASVPQLCPGGTVLCIGGGPSLTVADLDLARPHVNASIAINNAYQVAPWATALYAADARWWAWHKEGIKTFPGLKFSVSTEAKIHGVQILRQCGDTGLSNVPDGLCTGRNSGYQAIDLAVHFGAKRILLLGYDLQVGPKGEQHWHGDHPNKSRSAYDIFKVKFKTLVPPLTARGIEVLNCSRRTALDVFPKVPLEQALSRVAA